MIRFFKLWSSKLDESLSLKLIEDLNLRFSIAIEDLPTASNASIQVHPKVAYFNFVKQFRKPINFQNV